ncbi:jerky protein homolog-like [Octopus sinensis]|uniref:Jerky protein homolog-like n=1 Tax=Octopus sinensis TaxID=2607531 RepID=A0A6P7U8I1_9MOLL|nr:jerky protein homolog-like [Octopus sinensis]
MFHNLRSEISRKQYLKFAEIDDNTIAWVNSMDLKGAILNDRIITEKAKAFALNLGITEFKGSKGWLVKFKKRNGLKLRNMHGESATPNFDPNLVSDFIELIKNKISLYGAQNVYNADETGLFYKMIPSKSVCKTIKSGYKAKFFNIENLEYIENIGSSMIQTLRRNKSKLTDFFVFN